MSAPLAAADVLVKVARGVWRRVPGGVRKQVEDRVFYAIFQSTRVTNDAYGWRPAAPEPPPPAGHVPSETGAGG